MLLLDHRLVGYRPVLFFFFFQAEDGIRDAQESRGLGDVYKRQAPVAMAAAVPQAVDLGGVKCMAMGTRVSAREPNPCLL